MFKRITIVVSLHIIAVVFVLVALFIGIKCPLYETFEIYCPGCGATRMLKEFLHLHIYAALHYNMFIFVTAPIVVYKVYEYVYYYLTGRNIPTKLDKQIIAYAIFLVIFGVARNFDIFSFLQPVSVV